MSSRPTIIKVLDREDNGRCQECARENIRWVAVLSDGSTVGSECAKKITGQVFIPANYSWVTGATEVAATVDCDTTWVMWTRGTRAYLAANGILKSVGSVDSITAEMAAL